MRLLSHYPGISWSAIGSVLQLKFRKHYFVKRYDDDTCSYEYAPFTKRETFKNIKTHMSVKINDIIYCLASKYFVIGFRSDCCSIYFLARIISALSLINILKTTQSTGNLSQRQHILPS